MIDKLHATPVNRAAMKELTAPKGYTACVMDDCEIHPEPLEVLMRRVPQIIDLRGVVFGSGARVIGFCKQQRREYLWTVQCQCGRYDTIMQRGILMHLRKEKDHGENYRGWVCAQCYVTNRIKQGWRP
jgi:hypothetical protein